VRKNYTELHGDSTENHRDYEIIYKIIDMNLFTIITAVTVIGIVWGGLTFFLTRAFKYEKLKQENGKE
jgi:hypothetical protein